MKLLLGVFNMDTYYSKWGAAAEVRSSCLIPFTGRRPQEGRKEGRKEERREGGRGGVEDAWGEKISGADDSDQRRSAKMQPAAAEPRRTDRPLGLPVRAQFNGYMNEGHFGSVLLHCLLQQR